MGFSLSLSLLPAILATGLLAFTLVGLPLSFPPNAPAFAGRTTVLETFASHGSSTTGRLSWAPTDSDILPVAASPSAYPQAFPGAVGFWDDPSPRPHAVDTYSEGNPGELAQRVLPAR